MLAVSPSTSSLSPLPSLLTPLTPPAPTVMNVAPSNGSELRNLELMHKFSTETYKSLCADASLYHAWQVIVPQKAFSHDFLLSGILALSSLHIASTVELPAASSYIDTALQYYHMTFAPFRKALDNISPMNCDAVFVHSVITMAISISLPKLTAQRDETSSMIETVTAVFELLRGTSNIYHISRSWFSTDFFSNKDWASTVPERLDADTQMALTRLEVLNDELVLDAGQRQINQNAISILQSCFSRSANLENPIEPVMAWLAMVDKEFCSYLRHRRALSLLILMHWGTLLGELDGRIWWARSAGKALISELLMILHSGDSRWEAARMWPQQKLAAK